MLENEISIEPGRSSFEQKDLSLCLATLMAMRTKLEHRPKNTTIEKGLLMPIYNGMDREAIRKVWRGFIRELWLRSIPVDETNNQIPIVRQKTKAQTLLHAQDVFANMIYEYIFCNALKAEHSGRLKNMNLKLGLKVSDTVNFYEAIPSPHRKYYILFVN